MVSASWRLWPFPWRVCIYELDCVPNFPSLRHRSLREFTHLESEVSRSNHLPRGREDNLSPAAQKACRGPMWGFLARSECTVWPWWIGCIGIRWAPVPKPLPSLPILGFRLPSLCVGEVFPLLILFYLSQFLWPSFFLFKLSLSPSFFKKEEHNHHPLSLPCCPPWQTSWRAWLGPALTACAASSCTLSGAGAQHEDWTQKLWIPTAWVEIPCLWFNILIFFSQNLCILISSVTWHGEGKMIENLCLRGHFSAPDHAQKTDSFSLFLSLQPSWKLSRSHTLLVSKLPPSFQSEAHLELIHSSHMQDEEGNFM